MPRKTTKRPMTLKAMLTREPELGPVSRQMASLAFAQLAEDTPLSVRQREQLRRAFATAGDALGWAGAIAHSGDSIATVSTDVMTLAKGGAKAQARDLADELARKRVEVVQLEDAIITVRKLGEAKGTTYPTEFTYCFTARSATRDLITKTDTLVLNDAGEAESATASIEKTLPNRTKLADLMIIDLEQKGAKLEVMTKSLGDFFKSRQELLREVLVNLQ